MTEFDLDRRLERAVGDLPAFPQSVQRVIEMSSDINCMPKDLVEILERDPVLTGRILNLVNSAYFSLARRVDSIRHALVYLGLNTIKHLALSLAAIGAMPKTNASGLEMRQFQLHALATGEVMRHVGKHMMAKGLTLDQLYLLGLFHNLGEALCAVYCPKEWQVYRETVAASWEELDGKGRALFGAPPRIVTVQVLEKWEMATAICEGVSSFPSGDGSDAGIYGRALLVSQHFLHHHRTSIPMSHVATPLAHPDNLRILGLLLEDSEGVLESVERAESFLSGMG